MSVPACNFVVDSATTPLLKVTVPNVRVPPGPVRLIVPVPVAPPGAAEETVAVIVTVCPKVDGFDLVLTVVVEG